MRTAIIVVLVPGSNPSCRYFDAASQAKEAYKELLPKLTPDIGLELWTSDGGRTKKRRGKTPTPAASLQEETIGEEAVAVESTDEETRPTRVKPKKRN